MANCNYWGGWNFPTPKNRQEIEFDTSETGRELLRSITDAKRRIEQLNEERELRRNLTDLW